MISLNIGKSNECILWIATKENTLLEDNLRIVIIVGPLQYTSLGFTFTINTLDLEFSIGEPVDWDLSDFDEVLGWLPSRVRHSE